MTTSSKPTKKPISIGAALRQRMSEAPEVLEAPITELSEAPLQLEGIETPKAPEPVDDPLESFNTRLRRSLLKRLKVYSAVHALKIQDVMDAALEQYLSSEKD
jgi:hypothetical protein